MRDTAASAAAPARSRWRVVELTQPPSSVIYSKWLKHLVLPLATFHMRGMVEENSALVETKLIGHSGPAYAVAVIDDDHVVSAGRDTIVRVWNIQTGDCVRTMSGHSERVTGLAVLEDRDRCVSTSYDKMLRVWSTSTGECLDVIETNAGSHFVAALGPHQPQWCVTEGENHGLDVWDLTRSECVRHLAGHTDRVFCVTALGPDCCVSGSKDTTLKIWCYATGECIDTLRGHTKSILSVAALPSDQCVSASEDSTLRVWCTLSGQSVHTLRGHHRAVYCVSALPGRRCVSTGRWDGIMRVWCTVAGECLRAIAGSFRMFSVAGLSGDRCVSTGSDEHVKVWSLRSYGLSDVIYREVWGELPGNSGLLRL